MALRITVSNLTLPGRVLLMAADRVVGIRRVDGQARICGGPLPADVDEVRVAEADYRNIAADLATDVTPSRLLS